MRIDSYKLMNIRKVINEKGSLSSIESFIHVPFAIKRIYFLYDTPSGQIRGLHAHRNLKQFMIPVCGSLDVWVDDGFKQEVFHLNKQDEGLYTDIMTWREMRNFAPGTVVLMIASELHDKEEYIFDYNQFTLEVKNIF